MDTSRPRGAPKGSRRPRRTVKALLSAIDALQRGELETPDRRERWRLKQRAKTLQE